MKWYTGEVPEGLHFLLIFWAERDYEPAASASGPNGGSSSGISAFRPALPEM
jgi:hypothetical protein